MESDEDKKFDQQYQRVSRQDRSDHRDSERTWLEYRQLIISELERLNNSLNDMNNRLDRNYHEYGAEFSKIKVDIAMLQIKSGIWGGIAGAVIAIVAVLLRYISTAPGLH